MMAVLFVCKVNNIFNIGKMKNVHKKLTQRKVWQISEKLNSLNRIRHFPPYVPIREESQRVEYLNCPIWLQMCVSVWWWGEERRGEVNVLKCNPMYFSSPLVPHSPGWRLDRVPWWPINMFVSMRVYNLRMMGSLETIPLTGISDKEKEGLEQRRPQLWRNI